MSLKPCPECGHNYSNKAKSCPQCASPNDDYESTSDKMFSGVNALILLGALFGGCCFLQPLDPRGAGVPRGGGPCVH